MGNADYDPAAERQSLYLEYAKVLAQLQPAVAVMENVRGMLSARHDGRPIFSDVMDSLMHAGGTERYRLFSLAPHAGRSWGLGLIRRTSSFARKSTEYRSHATGYS